MKNVLMTAAAVATLVAFSTPAVVKVRFPPPTKLPYVEVVIPIAIEKGASLIVVN